jgi:GntR family transcriptional regulator / MocR family aminotransferase
MRYQATLTFPITVDRHSRQSLHEQIAGHIRAAMEHGLLVNESRLPSTRTLAGVLGVSRGVTSAAYDALFTLGYLRRTPGSGTYTTRPPTNDRARAATAIHTQAPPIDLRPGRAGADSVPLRAWRAAWREATFRRPPAVEPPLGLPSLRQAIIEQLSRARGIPLADREVVITGGLADGLQIVLDALELCGPQVAIEEPVPSALRHAAGASEGPPAALAVDRDGARLDTVPTGCRAIVVSLDKQVPLGHVMSATRRVQAAAWAIRTGGTVIEIAGALTPSARTARLPRLERLAGDRCVLVGELVVPGLTVGYAVLPRELARIGGLHLADRAKQLSSVTQLAAATLLRDGSVDRLARRLERSCAERSRLVESALAPLRGARYHDCAGSGTAILYLPTSADAQQAADSLLARGVRVSTLAPYYFSGRRVPPALVLDYVRPSDADLRHCLSVFRGAEAAPTSLT